MKQTASTGAAPLPAGGAPARIDPREALELLSGRRGRGMSLLDRFRSLLQACGEPGANGEDVGAFLVAEVDRLRGELGEMRGVHARLEQIIEQLSGPPFHPAVFLGWFDQAGERIALVSQGQGQRAVRLGPEVDAGALGVGDPVLLASERNVLVAKSTLPLLTCGETAIFDRTAPEGRLVLKSREEEIVVVASARLAADPPRPGDAVRWDRNAWLAIEVVPRPGAEQLFVRESPRETFADIGGLDGVIAEIKNAFLLHFLHPEEARQFGVRRCGAVTLAGPPGVGKTMLARAVASWLGDLSASGRSCFINVKPGALKSMWYAQTEANIRGLFKSARELAESDPAVPVVLFMDEIDSLASARSGSMLQVDDRVQQAFAAELNGFEERGNVMIICATNRIDALDPALVREGRLGDRVITVPRPDLEAARSIFGKHLGPRLPYAANGTPGPRVREEIIESALARIFAPNGAEELAVVCFRDGRRTSIRPEQLLSGAMIAGIANDACERACLRAVEGRPGPEGVAWSDVESALTGRLEQAAGLLTAANCRKFLGCLPEDVDVVAVERPRRRTVPEHRYVIAH